MYAVGWIENYLSQCLCGNCDTTRFIVEARLPVGSAFVETER